MLGDSPKPRELSTSKGHVRRRRFRRFDEIAPKNSPWSYISLYTCCYQKVPGHFFQDFIYFISFQDSVIQKRILFVSCRDFEKGVADATGEEIMLLLRWPSCNSCSGMVRGRCKCLVSCDINTKLRGFFDVFIPCTSGHCSVFGWACFPPLEKTNIHYPIFLFARHKQKVPSGWDVVVSHHCDLSHWCQYCHHCLGSWLTCDGQEILLVWVPQLWMVEDGGQKIHLAPVFDSLPWLS